MKTYLLAVAAVLCLVIGLVLRNARLSAAKSLEAVSPNTVRFVASQNAADGFAAGGIVTAIVLGALAARNVTKKTS